MVGITVPLPLQLEFFSFGGLMRYCFGDLNQYGADSIRFYTKPKTVTARWPSGVKEGADFAMPTS
jgi:malonate-semialdehyde dehydrogenase (acetylating)/methylmalonate-semialdehyde dehydrogenase